MQNFVVQKLKVTATGVELLDGQSGDPRWCLDFRDMDSPAIILLADNYGNRSVDSGGFVLCPMYGRKSKAFTAAAGASNSAIVSYLVMLFPSLLLSENVASSGYFKVYDGHCGCSVILLMLLISVDVFAD